MSISNAAQKGIKFFKILFYILIIVAAGGILINHFFGGLGNTALGNLLPDSPRDVQVKYIPKDFDYQMDEEQTLRILSNPQRYRQDFNQMVYDFNLAMLYHVADRMDMPDSLRSLVAETYEEHHPYIRQMYYNDILALTDSTDQIYDQWYRNESGSAVEAFYEVASKYTCFLVNHVVVTLLEVEGGSLRAGGRDIESPCGIALQEVLSPTISRLKDRAAIRDFERSKGLMEERIESVVAELATMEVRDKKGLSRQVKTKVLGYDVSKTDVEISAISIMKVGFKLDEYFDIELDSRRKKAIVTLPDPIILSHEVYPQIDKLSVGWLREISDEDFNKNFNLLRREFRRDALNSDIMAKARIQAEELMKTLFSPVVTHFNREYSVEVRFKSTGNAFDERSEEEILRE